MGAKWVGGTTLRRGTLLVWRSLQRDSNGPEFGGKGSRVFRHSLASNGLKMGKGCIGKALSRIPIRKHGFRYKSAVVAQLHTSFNLAAVGYDDEGGVRRLARWTRISVEGLPKSKLWKPEEGHQEEMSQRQRWEMEVTVPSSLLPATWSGQKSWIPQGHIFESLRGDWKKIFLDQLPLRL